jgi:hypothetical protein
VLGLIGDCSNPATGNQCWIAFQHNAEIAVRAAGKNANIGTQESLYAFEEHPGDGNSKPHHWTTGSNQDVGLSQMMLITIRTGGLVVLQQMAEGSLSQACNLSDVGFPGLRPAKIANKFSRQTEREVERGDPRAFGAEEGFEIGKIGPVLHCLNLHGSIPDLRLGAGKGLPRPWGAGEVDAIDRMGSH